MRCILFCPTIQIGHAMSGGRKQKNGQAIAVRCGDWFGFFTAISS
jgi:hypothetical protein